MHGRSKAKRGFATCSLETHTIDCSITPSTLSPTHAVCSLAEMRWYVFSILPVMLRIFPGCERGLVGWMEYGFFHWGDAHLFSLYGIFGCISNFS